MLGEQIAHTFRETEVEYPHNPAFEDVLDSTRKKFNNKYGFGRAIEAWMENSKKYGEMSPREIYRFKQEIIRMLVEKEFKKNSVKNVVRRKSCALLLQFAKPSVLSLPHVGKNVNVYCLTIPISVYGMFCRAFGYERSQGLAVSLGLNQFATMFDRIVISTDSQVGGGMPPEQVKLHEATHCTDVMAPLRSRDENNLLTEIVAVLGECAIPEKKSYPVVVDKSYFEGYFSDQLIANPPKSLLLLLGVSKPEKLDRSFLAGKLRNFLLSISIQLSNTDSLLLCMSSASFDELYTALFTRYPKLFSSDGSYAMSFEKIKADH